MGIKNLNRLFIETCSKQATRRVDIHSFAGKTVVVDTSIYMYKFIAQNALIENMYLLISIFIKNKISPIFVFDGKSPPEKRDLINQRRILKKDAEKKYTDLQSLLSTASPSSKQDIEIEMESLKKKFIRIKETDVSSVKSLMRAYGASYCDAEGEADKLCVYMVKTGKAWACLSDDMDMFVYGCPRVLRHVSLLKHSAILYDLDIILRDLDMSMNDFRQVTVISGTDYNINLSTSLGETMKLYNQFKNESRESSENELLFYNWLYKFTKYIRNYDDLISVHNMFYIHDNDDNLASREIQSFIGNIGMMKTVLKLDGFVFP
jgi:flap endonuclease-1